MNLLNKDLWDYAFPWGTSTGDLLVNMLSDFVIWNSDGTVNFNVGYKDPLHTAYSDLHDKSYKGWIRDENWNKIDWYTQYAAGQIISKEKYGFGTYEMNFHLPNFRGSWPAWWMLDIDKLPPEIDIFEHFRKDGFLTRFHLTTTYHDGPNYESGDVSKAKYTIIPVDCNDIKLKMIWTSDKMEFYFNGCKYFTIERSEWPYFPITPMNVIVNSGLGTWFKNGVPQPNKFEPFIVKSLIFEAV
jgi:beta-glucanase (GH16 family)